MNSNSTVLGQSLRWCGIALAALLIASGCGGGSNRNRNGYGNVFVSYSASPGEFSSYKLTVSSVTLTRSDGASVTAVSASEIVDFAALGDAQELVSNTAIPIGTYTSATVNLDYTSAAIAVNVNGVPTTASVVDSTGAAAKTVAVVVTFDSANPLVIAQSQAQRLNVDFDLPAANTINAAVSPVAVTERAFLTVTNDPNSGKLIRIRGPLISFNSSQGTYTVYVRPFLDEGNNLGALTLFGASDSIYTINDEVLVGAAGVDAVTKLGTGAITTAFTIYAPDAKAGTFTLVRAFIGSSNESGSADRLEGTVIARNGDTLTLRGGTLNLRTGTFTYYTTDATVTVSDATLVTIDGQGSINGANKNSISVGQHIVVLGQSTVANGVVTLDAAAGRVRVADTRIWGVASGGAVGSLVFDLRAIGPWPVSVFNFSGTGATSSQDALPQSYLLSTGTVDASAITGNALADGIVAPFGAAPPDFLANSVASIDSAESSLEVEFSGAGTVTPFSTIASTGLVANVTDPSLGAVHAIITGPFAIDITTLAADPTIVPDTTLRSEFSLGSTASGISVYSDFGAFIGQLNSAAGASKAAHAIHATGRYDAATNTFVATHVNVALL